MGKERGSEVPKCYTPNDSPYPLCKGNENALHDCKDCNFYEDMDESQYTED